MLIFLTIVLGTLSSLFRSRTAVVHQNSPASPLEVVLSRFSIVVQPEFNEMSANEKVMRGILSYFQQRRTYHAENIHRVLRDQFITLER